RDVVGAADDAFGIEKTRGELEILAGRAHRHGDAALAVIPVDEIAEPDLERLLGRDDVVLDAARRVGSGADPPDLELPHALAAQRVVQAGRHRDLPRESATPRPALRRAVRRPAPR